MSYRQIALAVWRHLPAAVALPLLAYQMAIPWVVPHFTTQDGPSHLYASNVMFDLVRHHKTSPYSALYTVQRRPVPNWTANLLLALSSSAAGVSRAEALFASMAMLAGFLGWCYCAREISPLANAMLLVWFLWMGLYNFYLGMLLLPFVLGFYWRRAGELTWNHSAALAGGLVVLWLTHPVPVVIAMFALPMMAIAASGRRDLDKLAAAFAPTVLLLAFYALGRHESASGGSTAAVAWRDFPMHTFQTGAGYAGAQRPLSSFLLWYMAAALLLLRKREWRSPLGGLAAAAIACFLLYLFIPDAGLGGSMVKIRFSWALFVLGGLMAWSASRLRHFRNPAALIVAALVAAHVPRTVQATRRLSEAATDYAGAANAIPPRAVFVRLYYPTPQAAERFGYLGMGVDPLFHLDAGLAARAHSVDLSDYEAITGLFPVVYKKSIDPGFQATLWAMEGPRDWTVGVLKWLGSSFPAHITDILVVGDQASPEAVAMGMPQMLAYLDSTMCRTGVSASGLVRVYRNGACSANTKAADP